MQLVSEYGSWHAWECPKLTVTRNLWVVKVGLAEVRPVFREHQGYGPESSNMFGKKRQEQVKGNLGTRRERYKDIYRS